MKRRARQLQPPAGLREMFSLVRTASCTPGAARRHAQRAYPVARRVIKALEGDYGEYERALQTAVPAFFATAEDLTEASVNLEAGFMAGVATAWLLMRQINGGER